MRFFNLPLSSEGDASGGASGSTATPQMITVQIDGKDVQVPRPAGFYSEKEISEKWVPKAAHNDQMARMRRDLDARANYRNPDDLLKDDEFKARASQEWGIDPSASAKQFQERLNQTRQELTEREIKPREEKLGKAYDLIDRLLVKDLHGQILQAAAAAHVDERYLRAAVKGGKPLIVSMLEETFDFDHERGEWFAKDGKGGFLYAQGGDQPYQTVQQFLGGWAESDDGKAYLRAERQKGAQSRTDGESVPGQVGNVVRVTREQVRDIAFMRKLNERAEKEGLTIQPV